MSARQYSLGVEDEIVADWFAGGGGMSEAIFQALGRHADVSANHDSDACSMHAVNHPQTEHMQADVREIDPRKAARGRPVGLFHLSPDCTHHSQAKGGQPRDRTIRALSWVGVWWAGTVKPRIITLENVKQILQWGPLIAKRDPATSRVIKLDGTVAEPGERVPLEQQYLIPDKKRAGTTWRRFVSILRGMGYVVEWKVLCAADFGAPTTRERLFMVARCDGAPIVWPEPTHFKEPKRGQLKWRAAAECIDWSIPGKSIFDREKSLAEATMRRIAHGMKRYVLDSPTPYIVNNMANNVPRPVGEPAATILTSGHKMLVTPTLVPVTHQGSDRVHNIAEPLRTVTTAQRGEFALASATLIQMGHGQGTPSAPRWSHGANDIQKPVGTITASGGGQGIAAATLVQVSYGEREGQAPRSLDVEQPLGTVVAGGIKHAAVTAFLAQANGGFNETPGHDVRRPMSTVTNRGSQQQLVTAHLTTLRRNCTGRGMDEPVPTLTAGAEHHALVEYTLSKEHEAGALRCAAFLMRYHGNGGQWSDLRDPMTTSTTKGRLALVTVWLAGEPWVIVDICLRMLEPRELYNANGFPPDYIIDRGHDGRRFTKSTQVRLCGNAVSPPPAVALLAANWHSRTPMREAA